METISRIRARQDTARLQALIETQDKAVWDQLAAELHRRPVERPITEASKFPLPFQQGESLMAPVGLADVEAVSWVATKKQLADWRSMNTPEDWE